MSSSTTTSFSGMINGRPLSADAERKIHLALKDTLEAEIAAEMQAGVANAHASGHGSSHGSSHASTSST